MPLNEMDVKQSAYMHSLKDGSLADVVVVVLRVGNDAPDVESTRPAFSIYQPPAAPTDTLCPDSLIVFFSINSIKRVNYKSISVDGFFSSSLSVRSWPS